MGHAPRQRPVRLAAKLLQIRKFLGLSQNQMIRRLGFSSELIQSHISAYEQEGEKGREPPLGVLLQYARIINTPVENLIDDALDLELLPKPPKTLKQGQSKSRPPVPKKARAKSRDDK